MGFPKIVRQTPVKHGDEWALVVSTIQVGFRAYETAVFDDTPGKRLEGWTLDGRIIEHTVDKASTRDEAMDQHREALYAARTGTPHPPRFEVRELDPRCFVVDDTVTQLSYDMSFTRKAAQKAADWRNARQEA